MPCFGILHDAIFYQCLLDMQNKLKPQSCNEIIQKDDLLSKIWSFTDNFERGSRWGQKQIIGLKILHTAVILFCCWNFSALQSLTVQMATAWFGLVGFKCVRMWAHILHNFIGQQFVCSALVNFRQKHTFDWGEQCSLKMWILCNTNII